MPSSPNTAPTVLCLHRLQLGDTLWFVGSIETNYFVSKITGLERTQARQLRKLNTDILDRQLVQVVGQVICRRFEHSSHICCMILDVHGNCFMLAHYHRQMLVKPLSDCTCDHACASLQNLLCHQAEILQPWDPG